MMLLFLSVAFSAMCYAEVFQGEVKSVAAQVNQILMIRKDPAVASAEARECRVQTSGETKLENFASLEDLRAGDEVDVNADWNEEQNLWQAKSLSVAKVKIEECVF